MKHKIIFWLDSNFVHFGLADSIKKKYDCDLYAIFDVTNKPKKFYEKQNIINFQKSWFYHDFINTKNTEPDYEYLKLFEERYQINLWTIACNERLFFTYNDYYNFNEKQILSILEQGCKLFEQILDEIKPDFLIMPITNQQHNSIFHSICKSKGIKILMMGATRFGNRQIISQDLDEIDYIENNLDDQNTEKTSFEKLQKFLHSYHMSNMVGNYIRDFQNSNISYIKAAFSFLFKNNENIETHYSYYGRTKLRVLQKMLGYTLRKKSRESFMNNNLSKTIDTSKPFIYFPLHQMQERVLLLGAPYLTNQLEVIKHIVKSLPVGYNLVVKDPPIQVTRGWRSISELKEIMKLPNVQLVHWSIPSIDILKKCSLVVSIKGSTAIEAAFYEKPAIVFSQVGYSNLKSIVQIKDFEQLPKTIRTSLNRKVELQDLSNYVELIKKHSFEFDYNSIYLDFANEFHHNGFFVDMELSESEIRKFLDKHSTSFDFLAEQHINKIHQHTSKN